MIQIIGFLFVSIIGSILHFTYDLSNHNKTVGIFSSVNESVWEHMKLVMLPYLVYLLIEIPFLYKNPNFIFSKFCGLICILALIPLLFYTKKLIIKKSILIIDILIFYVSIGIGFYVEFYILGMNAVCPIINYIGLVLLIIIYIYFYNATIYPGEGNIFIDPITKKKGFKGHH